MTMQRVKIKFTFFRDKSPSLWHQTIFNIWHIVAACFQCIEMVYQQYTSKVRFYGALNGLFSILHPKESLYEIPSGIGPLVSEKMFEDVDGRLIGIILISSFTSIQFRLAKNHSNIFTIT